MMREPKVPKRKFRLNQLHLNEPDTLRGISYKWRVQNTAQLMIRVSDDEQNRKYYG
jgi:hypothetical protein